MAVDCLKAAGCHSEASGFRREGELPYAESETVPHIGRAEQTPSLPTKVDSGRHSYRIYSRSLKWDLLPGFTYLACGAP